MRILSRAFRVGAAVTVAVGVSVGLAVSAQAGDSPAGFNFGTDSSYVSVPAPAPYRNPVMGGNYGGYVGMVGNWARVEGCTTGNFLDFSYSNRDQANTNYNTYHIGIGTAAYWYMGGPGVDPNWNGSTAEAANWGAQQASRMLTAVKALGITYPVLWADIERPGIAPGLGGLPIPSLPVMATNCSTPVCPVRCHPLRRTSTPPRKSLPRARTSRQTPGSPKTA